MGKEHQLIGADNVIGGTIVFNTFEQIAKPNFIEYLQKGWYVNMSVAIDFTASNRSGEGKSRHDIDWSGATQNEYEVAITQVGRILENYSHKQLFSGYGFGGIPDFGDYKGNTMVQHCFTLTGCKRPCVEGLKNFLPCYKNAASNTKLWGPTCFAPVIDMQKRFIELNKEFPMYHVLLILTDGGIHDLRESIDLIVDCSFEPLSVIIIGIGDDSDFCGMEIIDADDVVLVNGLGQTQQRDICNFVNFNEVKRHYAEIAGIDIKDVDINSPDFGDLLSEEVLAEVPDQIVGYMLENDIKPEDCLNK